MGFTRFWLRLLLLASGVILLWLMLINWNPFSVNSDEFPKVNLNEDGSLDSKRIDVQRVLIAVYYETLCSDSRGFIRRQLEPTYQKIPENIIIEMIPYGKATTLNGPNGFEFTCQHGPRECEANTIHACAIEIIKNPTVQLNFIACMIERNLWPVNITKSCAERLRVDAEPILSCARTAKGAELLAKYGRMTHALKPEVSFIPTITLDGDSGNQPVVLNSLLKEVCKRLKVKPVGCQ